MKERQLDALLISHPPDIEYLTGFGGEDSWALLTPRTVVILSDRRFEEELKRQCPFARSVMRRGSLAEAAGKVADQQKLKAIGVQGDALTVNQRQALVRQVGAGALRPIGPWLVDQRSVKDEHEIRLIQRAVRIQEKAFAELCEWIEPNMTERHVAARLDYLMRVHGATGASFRTIVAAGANASIPHHLPGETKLRRNNIVLIDFGARFGSYCSDMTRVVALGRMPRKMREVYTVVQEAQQAGIEAIKPGVAMKEVDAAARQVIVNAGYGRHFGHSLGHGIGLEVHEQPSLSPRSRGELKAGQVVTVEPGIYLPGVGGVRLEDDVRVTARGRRNLCSLPLSVDSAII